MLGQDKVRSGRRLGPFTGRQLTVVIVAISGAIVLTPVAAMAAVGAFTSSTATPAVTATNSATVAGGKGVSGAATGSGNVARYGVTGSASGTQGIGVEGTGTQYGVYSNGSLGVATGKSLACTGCVGRSALSSTAVAGKLLYQQSALVFGPWNGSTVASFTVPAGLMCVQGSASAYATSVPVVFRVYFSASGGAPTPAYGLLLNQVNVHETLASEGVFCASVSAGTYSYKSGTVSAGGGVGTSDGNDLASIAVQVFSQ